MARIRVLVFGVVLSLFIVAGAQLPPGFKMPSLWYNPGLTMDPGIQKELKLSPPVASKIQGIIFSEGMKMAPALTSMMGGKPPTQAEAARADPLITDAFAKMQKACIDNLNAAQLQRLHELTLQSFGPKAVLDPKVGNQVGLTAAQENKLKAEMTKLGEVQRAAAKNLFSGGAHDPKAARAMMASTRMKSEALLDSVLTLKQKAKWKALQGRPYHFTGYSAMMGGG